MKTHKTNIKKQLLISISIILMLVICSGCGSKTLYEITEPKKGGSLRIEEDKYNVIEITFYGEKQTCPEGKNNCCHVIHRVYKDSASSPSGVIMDTKKSTTECIPCVFDDVSLTLNGVDNYTYTLETKGEYEYVVFSKELLGHTYWYIDKNY